MADGTGLRAFNSKCFIFLCGRATERMNFMNKEANNNKMNITAGTIARTIILVLALINQLLTATGHSVINISDESINTLISTGFTIVTAVIAWWKNNSFTQSALKADEVMREGKENASRTSD